ncbi:uncharacterized protein DEA37_0003437 [Paragonimus westermani]|uniref:CAP-Gly domain-containing protein n=1 Tax=Paragonimus westermani TaxID=34504 RepID=A0A5J4P0W5_9TREM|nr:uncharacterized protein DEA37_0003437 [Paragonimus westermani]
METSDTVSDVTQGGDFSLNDRVFVGSGTERIGTVAYIGETQFAPGEWIGVVLSAPTGKNDGTVGGVCYFQCKPMHGIFSKRQNLRHVSAAVTDNTEIHHSPNTPDCDQMANKHHSAPFSPKSVSNNAPSCKAENFQCAFKVGDRVQVSGGRIGTLKYLGPAEFAPGEWAGIELDEPLGKNDGSVGGKRYFSCKPNFGLFATSRKLMIPGSKQMGTPQLRRSQESLLSYCSNLSSVSRSYRAHYAPSRQGRTSSSSCHRPSSVLTHSGPKESSLSNVQVLQRLIREKEEHISQLLEERDIERSDLARANLDREMAVSEISNQRAQMEQLNEQLLRVEAAHRALQEEHEQLLTKLHEERKALEDLQFRMEEENIDKSTLENINADDESKIFELEEALMFARETNERTDAELVRVRGELEALLTRQQTAERSSTCNATDLQVTVSACQTDTDVSSEVPRIALVESITNASLEPTQPVKKDAKVGSPSKSSLYLVNSVSHASVSPTQPNADTVFQTELDRLHQELVDRERITESALKRQAEVLEVVTADFEKQLAEAKAQFLSASRELITSREECSSLRKKLEMSTADLQKEIDGLKVKMAEEDAKNKEKIICFQNRVSDLTATLEKGKGKTSVTVMEQAVALRKMEEKLRITERQLLDYQSSVLSSAETYAREQAAELNSISDTIDVDEDTATLLAQLKDQEESLRVQREHVTELQQKHDAALVAQQASDGRAQQLENDLIRLRTELLASSHKQEELTRALQSAHQVRDQLVNEITALLDELPPVGESSSVEDLTQGLRVRIDQLSRHVTEAENNRSILESRVTQLEMERDALEREIALLKASAPITLTDTDTTFLTEQITEARNKVAQLEASTGTALSNLESKSMELRSVQDQLDQTLAEHSQLQHSHNEAIEILEAEKRQLLERIKVLESGATLSASSATGDQLSSLMDEKASADSQIAFLNSIIVDLHKKNAELEERVRSMLVGSNGNPREFPIFSDLS